MTKICENCNKEHESAYGSGRFCSSKCARGFSTKNENILTKKVTCISCKIELEVNKRANANKVLCSNCKSKLNNKKNKCKSCGQLKYICKNSRPDICKKHRLFPSLIKYFGFNESKIGTVEIFKEYEQTKNILIEDYYTYELSLVEIMNKYNYNSLNVRNFSKLFNSLDIIRRTLSKSSTLAYKNQKSVPPYSTQYLHGWHNDWQGNKHFYRSSYELDYYKKLDDKQIEYKTENLRILYWDSIKLIQRIAIPDIYIQKENLIIEIKSNWTYDELNMQDKIKAYKEHGYNFKLILEHKEI